MQAANIYTLNIRENFNKKLKFSIAMSVVKISIQITVVEDVTLELIRLLIEFIIKYWQNTGLNVQKVCYRLQLNNNT